LQKVICILVSPSHTPSYTFFFSTYQPNPVPCSANYKFLNLFSNFISNCRTLFICFFFWRTKRWATWLNKEWRRGWQDTAVLLKCSKVIRKSSIKIPFHLPYLLSFIYFHASHSMKQVWWYKGSSNLKLLFPHPRYSL